MLAAHDSAKQLSVRSLTVSSLMLRFDAQLRVKIFGGVGCEMRLPSGAISGINQGLSTAVLSNWRPPVGDVGASDQSSSSSSAGCHYPEAGLLRLFYMQASILSVGVIYRERQALLERLGTWLACKKLILRGVV